MRKNKFIVMALVIALLIAIVGCTVQPTDPGRTQTRIGMGNNNNNLRRNNNNNLRRNNGMNARIRNNNNDLIDMNDDITDMDNNLKGNITDDDGRIGNDNGNVNNNNIAKRANRIADRIEKLNEVNSASVLISGETAIVGVDMKANVQGQLTKNLKQKIERIVKNTDDDIENVSITADPDLFTRITDIADDIMDGKPVSGFASQIEEILRRITPIR